MKHLQLFTLIVCLAALVGCESTQTAGEGNQEAKRRAAIAKAQQNEQPDESQRNLYNAQQAVINRDGNPARRP